MNRFKANLSKVLLIATLAVGPLVGAPGKAQAQIVVRPPAVYIATSRPEYFGGRPNYWYHSQWYYRDGRSWNYYHTEPQYLHDRRSSWGVRGQYRYHR
jgi:hypothetical protein